MRNGLIGSAVLMLAALGAGCSGPSLPSLSLFPEDLAPNELDLTVGSTIGLEQTDINPLENLGDKRLRVMTVTDWAAGDRADVAWSETFERETAASIEARSEAERSSGVGEETAIPEPIYETITLEGSLKTDALDDGQRILLPSEWEEGGLDLRGGPNTIIWLSRSQYDELESTRHTHLSIGLFDAGLQTAADTAEAIKGFISKITGNDDAIAVSDQDVTEIVADAEWGTYTLKWNGKKVRVQTIQAENKFASYTILANPDNPLILEVELKAWAYGTEALGVISDELQIAGYSVIEITSP